MPLINTTVYSVPFFCLLQSGPTSVRIKQSTKDAPSTTRYLTISLNPSWLTTLTPLIDRIRSSCLACAHVTERPASMRRSAAEWFGRTASEQRLSWFLHAVPADEHGSPHPSDQRGGPGPAVHRSNGSAPLCARLLHQRTTVLLGTPSTSRSDCGMAQSYRPASTVEQATRAERKCERCSSARLKMRGCGVPPRRRPTTLETLSACALS